MMNWLKIERAAIRKVYTFWCCVTACAYNITWYYNISIYLQCNWFLVAWQYFTHSRFIHFIHFIHKYVGSVRTRFCYILFSCYVFLEESFSHRGELNTSWLGRFWSINILRKTSYFEKASRSRPKKWKNVISSSKFSLYKVNGNLVSWWSW